MKIIKPFNQISRRQFLHYSALVSTYVASSSFLAGCAVDPVTGKKQLMMVSREQEIGIDKQQSPYQFSSDYGVTQDKRIGRYVSQVGKSLLPHVHRTDMPYRFKCVNATYINAYAFPGGSIAVTRGILLKLKNEAELASLLGHELGHVNARHSAEQMSKGQLSSLLVGGLAVAASTQSAELGNMTQQLGMLGQGLLLSSYSRDNEREADQLGNEYMVKSGYSSKGFVGLMKMLNSLNKAKPSSASILFSTHPMSSERLKSAVEREKGIYKHTGKDPLRRGRYMDRIASLRKKEKGIALLQQGEKQMGKKEYGKAEKSFRKSFRKMGNDYTGHILLTKSLMAQKKMPQAFKIANKAKKIYPSEAQGYYFAGMCGTALKRFDTAYQNFDRCGKILPGNPQITFFKGYCLDKKGSRKPAANHYVKYLKMTNNKSNQYSKYAFTRLKKWGYVK